MLSSEYSEGDGMPINESEDEVKTIGDVVFNHLVS